MRYKIYQKEYSWLGSISTLHPWRGVITGLIISIQVLETDQNDSTIKIHIAWIGDVRNNWHFAIKMACKINYHNQQYMNVIKGPTSLKAVIKNVIYIFGRSTMESCQISSSLKKEWCGIVRLQYQEEHTG